MIVAADELREVARGAWDEICVQRKPPPVGATCWLRTRPKARPACRVTIVDSWALEDGGWCARVALDPQPNVPRKPPAQRPTFRLTREQRTRLFAGDDSPLVCEDKPRCEPGDRYVLSWLRLKPFVDEHNNLHRPDPEALVWIEVTAVIRRRRGGWNVHIRLEDHRVEHRLPRSTPPAYDQALFERVKGDKDRPPTASEIEQAREEGDYTTDPTAAVDHLQAVDDETLASFAQDRDLRAAQEGELAQLRRERYEIEKRLLVARKQAEERGVDISSPLRVIERQLAKIERKVYEGKAA